MIPVEKIHLSRSQSRKRDDKKKLKNSVESIKRDGLLSHIVVQPREGRKGGYELICGPRRLESFRKLGPKEIPVPVLAHSLIDRESQRVARCENIYGKKLTPLERAKAYRKMMENYGYNQPEIGRIVGYTKTEISRTLSIFKLPANIQEAMGNGLSMHHARALLRLNHDQPTQQKVLQQIISKGLSARKTELLVEQILTLKRTPDGDRSCPGESWEVVISGEQTVKVVVEKGRIEVSGDFPEEKMPEIFKALLNRYEVTEAARSLLEY
ncbi:Nucleoid occlusion protein [subsurface metagenome]